MKPALPPRSRPALFYLRKRRPHGKTPNCREPAATGVQERVVVRAVFERVSFRRSAVDAHAGRPLLRRMENDPRLRRCRAGQSATILVTSRAFATALRVVALWCSCSTVGGRERRPPRSCRKSGGGGRLCMGRDGLLGERPPRWDDFAAVRAVVEPMRPICTRSGGLEDESERFDGGLKRFMHA